MLAFLSEDWLPLVYAFIILIILTVAILLLRAYRSRIRPKEYLALFIPGVWMSTAQIRDLMLNRKNFSIDIIDVEVALTQLEAQNLLESRPIESDAVETLYRFEYRLKM